jgi:exopolysaccharide biosynthesis polyprenyl glycosylphosphotransferase
METLTQTRLRHSVVPHDPFHVSRLRRVAGLFATIPSATWLLIDFIMPAVFMVLAYNFCPKSWWALHAPNHLSVELGTIIFGACVALCSHIFGLHERSTSQTLPSLISKAVLTMAVAIPALITISALVLFKDIGRELLIIASASTLAGLILTRSIVWHFATRNPECIGLLGDASFVTMAKKVIEKQGTAVKLCPIVLDESETHVVSLSGLHHWAAFMHMDELVFHGEATPEISKALFTCMDHGLRVSNFASYLEKNVQYVPVNQISETWFLANDVRALHPHYMVFKRLADILVSALGLILSSPFIFLAILAIKLESPGPAFYSQRRVGLRNRIFSIYKLRSMRLDAEANGAQWAKKGDSRVTRIGRIMRKTRIDELPQFWNILKGDMAFIGPRPERPEFVDQLAAAIPFYRQRHLVKPGLTGWAQINADYGASIEDAKHKLCYDLYYVKEASLQFDLNVCIRTIGAIMKGAR